MGFGFGLVGLEGLLQLRRLGPALHLGKRFQDVALGVVDVLERVVEQGVEGLLGHGVLQIRMCTFNPRGTRCVPAAAPKEQATPSRRGRGGLRTELGIAPASPQG